MSMQKVAIITMLVIVGLALIAKSVPANKSAPLPVPVVLEIPISPPTAPAEPTDLAAPAISLPSEVSLPVTQQQSFSDKHFSDKQRAMFGISNLTSSRYSITRTASPELMEAAQEHADYLAGHGYGAHLDGYGRMIQQPNAHDGWGDGTPQSRAAAHGFAGSLATDDPRSSIPGRNVTGEIIYCGKVPIVRAFSSWEQHDSGHWIPLTSREFDVAGFGYAENASGQGIFVGMYGDTRRKAADEPPMAASARAGSGQPAQQSGYYASYGILGRRQRWVGPQQSYQQPVYYYGGACSSGSCGRR